MRCVLAMCFRTARDAPHLREIGEVEGNREAAVSAARFGDSQSVPTETLQPQVPGDYALAETPVEVGCDDAVVCAVLVWANCGRSCCKVV
jgi:hypothetical protein